MGECFWRLKRMIFLHKGILLLEKLEELRKRNSNIGRRLSPPVVRFWRSVFKKIGQISEEFECFLKGVVAVKGPFARTLCCLREPSSQIILEAGFHKRFVERRMERARLRRDRLAKYLIGDAKMTCWSGIQKDGERARAMARAGVGARARSGRAMIGLTFRKNRNRRRCTHRRRRRRRPQKSKIQGSANYSSVT